MECYRIEGCERLRAGFKTNTLLKNGEDWDWENPKNSYVCVFFTSFENIRQIFSEEASDIAELHKCKKGEKIFLLKINLIDETLLDPDNTGAGKCWDCSKKYKPDINLMNDVEILGEAIVKTEYFEITQLNIYDYPIKVDKLFV
ncbi:MAG: hypothetical protein KAS53_03720 [Candidatus Cloacimonetes bacterium]|nr:hypothetical protein [Candidatus Cloacimonadota bacterium]